MGGFDSGYEEGGYDELDFEENEGRGREVEETFAEWADRMYGDDDLESSFISEVIG